MQGHRFPTEQDRMNAVNSLALTSVFITLVVFRLQFDYVFSTTFITGLALGLGYVGVMDSNVGQGIASLLKKLKVFDQKVLGVPLYYVIMPLLILGVFWMMTKEVNLLEYSLSYLLGTVAILVPKRIYDDRDFKWLSYICTQSFTGMMFYSTLKYQWIGLIGWTALAFVFTLAIDFFQGKPKE